MNRRKNTITVKVGEIINEKETEKDGWEFIEKIRKYRVMKVFPYIVLCVDCKTGIKRCFSLGDMIIRGMAEQAPELEALKKQDVRWERR